MVTLLIMNDKDKYIAGWIKINLDKVLLLWILLIICNFAVKAQQDPQFSQNQFNQLTVNPGFAEPHQFGR